MTLVVVALLALNLLAAPLAVEAQPAEKVPRIGLLSLATGATPRTQSFLQGLRDLGYVEGQHFVMEYRRAAGDVERLPELAAELVRARVDLIIAAGTSASLPAARATRTIPVVFLATYDPVGRGLVTSLARPGGNVTGVTLHVDITKHLQLLAQTVPTVSRVVYLYELRNEEYQKTYLTRLETDARASNVKLRSIAIRQTGDIDRVFPEIVRGGVDGLLFDNPAVILRAQHRICALARQHKLPAMGRGREFADAGCLLSYGENLEAIYRRGASYVDRILRGAKPGDLPIEQPDKFELVVNLKTAKALGLTIPQSVLVRADEVIQ